MEREIEIYRVRKAFDDIRSQKGAFLSLRNAIRLAEKTKSKVYDNKGNCLWEEVKKVEKSI